MNREERILDAAAGLFAARGFSSVGVDEIGAAAGVSGPAIYRHFSSKDEILGTLFEQGMDGIAQATAHDLDEPAAALRHMAYEHARHVLRNPELSAVWLKETRSLSPAHLRRFRFRARSYIAQWVAPLTALYPHAQEDDVRAVAHTVLGGLNSLADWPSGLRAEGRVDLLVGSVLQASRVLEGSVANQPRLEPRR